MDSHSIYSLYEKFNKMSFQNRCVIPTANGLTTLSIPLRGGRENKLPFGLVEIDNSQQWQTRHWRTITAAYNRSPYFEYFKFSLAKIYGTRFEKLYEWNLEILNWIFLNLELGLNLTPLDVNKDVGTKKITPLLPRNFQQPGLIIGHPVYPQVFMERIGFQPNVSIMDLLFCMGNNSGQLFPSML